MNSNISLSGRAKRSNITICVDVLPQFAVELDVKSKTLKAFTAEEGIKIIKDLS